MVCLCPPFLSALSVYKIGQMHFGLYDGNGLIKDKEMSIMCVSLDYTKKLEQSAVHTLHIVKMAGN